MRRRFACITAVLAATVLVAGCADTGFHYVKSSDDKTYFKVPDRWTLFDERAIVEGLGVKLTDQERKAQLEQSWRVGFDAAPKASLRHIGSSKTDDPSGLAVVRTLTFDDADAISTSTLRNYLFDIDAALQDQTGELLQYEELQLDGGFRGIHLVADIDVNGRRMTVDQTALLNQATTKLYVLLVSCSTACYDEHKGQIGEVVDSWTVRAK